MRRRTPKKYIDNPNPRANIGFMCYVPFNFYVYKNIYKHLKNAEFIVGDDYYTPQIGMPATHLEGLLDFFSKNKDIYWRFIDPIDKKISPNEFYSKYAVLVSTWYLGALSASFNQDKKLVRVLYGHAKDPWNFGPWSAFFDLVLSYGKYSQSFLSMYGNSKIVGNPKFDDWILNKIDKKEVLNLSKKLDKNKKTILYLPTHGLLSSISMAVTALNELSEDYNIIIKAHHNTNLFDSDKIVLFKRNHQVIYKSDKDDLLPLLKACDIVISDNSGAIFDAILADRPIILIDFLGNSFFNKTYNESIVSRFEGRNLGPATSLISLEQQIKKKGREIGPVIRNEMGPINQEVNIQLSVKLFYNALDLLDKNKKVYRIRRKYIRDQIFSYNDGKSGKRAANAIEELLYKTKPPKNFLATSINTYRDYLFGENKINDHSTSEQEAANITGLKIYSSIRSFPFFKRVKFVINEFFR